MVNKRKVWGNLVPYGQVWRAGANENTTISFSDPVTIEGKALPQGTYGLHMIPGENEWAVIFSKNSTAWGSFTYDQAEDALRVTVKPQPAEFHEALTYDFDDVAPDSSLVTLRWEKVAVPFKVGVNTHEIVAQKLHDQLRGLAQYTWEGWDEAANYLLAEKIELDQALKYSDMSIKNEERYDNLMTKSQILEALNRKEEATAARNKALTMANAVQLHGYARQLQTSGKQAEAFAIFKAECQEESRPVGRACGHVTHVLRTGRFCQRVQGNERGDYECPRRTKTTVAGDGQAPGCERRHKQVDESCSAGVLVAPASRRLSRGRPALGAARVSMKARTINSHRCPER